MADSDSDLSSAASDKELQAMEEDIKVEATKARGLDRWFKPSPKSAKTKKDAELELPKRAPSPPHEFVLADMDTIAFLVMFRSRFNDVFPKSLPHYGPQDIETGISGERVDENVERFLCALLDLVLNRQKHVERGHYGRALEDAITQHKSQWPKEWNGVNPLNGSNTFDSMSADERLVMLKSLVLWALHSSEAVNTAIKQAYKQTRRDDDRNQPKAVQPWFSDTWRRKYYLIEGQDDTTFRIYRENDAKTAKNNVWFSVAGTIEEARALADKLETEMPGNQGRLVADRIRMAIPRWEAGEEKRRKKEYRMARRAAFARPEPGFSLYEGRTRGKRMRYTYDDDNEDGIDDDSDMTSSRRGRSGASTPFEETRPTVTASGRQVKSRLGGAYGESMLTDQRKEADYLNATQTEDTEDEVVVGVNGRPVRGAAMPGKRSLTSATATRSAAYDGITSGSESEDDEAPDEPSGEEWDGDEDAADDESDHDDFEDEQSSEEDDLMGDQVLEGQDDSAQDSLVVQLRYRKGGAPLNGHHVNGEVGYKKSPLSEVTNMNGSQANAKTEPQKIGPSAVTATAADGAAGAALLPSSSSVAAPGSSVEEIKSRLQNAALGDGHVEKGHGSDGNSNSSIAQSTLTALVPQT